MDEQLQELLALMGAATFADGVAVVTQLNTLTGVSGVALGTKGAAATLVALDSCRVRLAAIEKAVGSSGDECVGAVRAALTSHAELPKAQARVAELEKSSETHALSALFAKASDEKKLTPAIRESVQAAFDAGDVTLKGAEAWLSKLLPVSALATEPKHEGAPAGNAGATLKHNGKTYAEMSGIERANLKKTNPELFKAMRSPAA
jgi:hypothetical protein